MYKIFIKSSAQKELNTLPAKERIRVEEKISKLSENPRPDGCTKLKGDKNYRIRQGNYRVVYSIQDTQLIIEIIKVRHRRFVYR